MKKDTIFAVSTHPGKAAIAIIRVSGPRTATVLQLMVPTKGRSSAVQLPVPRQALMTRIVHPSSSTDILDTGLVLWFPGPHSYTGEDMAEFHVHGGTAVVASVLTALSQIGGLRMADAGEFSRRAFDNDKMDLTALEGVADLINAETEAQRKLAVRQARGELHEMYERWRVRMVGLMAQIEAYIDFSEEENIEDGVYEGVCLAVEGLAVEIAGHLDDRRRGEILRNGVALSIVGPPNSGKSTLLNKLAQRQVAIVSPIAGTTRDIVETTLDIDGYPLVVRDTAGLRKSTDIIETEGIRRALESAKSADIRICMLDAKQVLLGGDAVHGPPEWKELLDLPHTFVVLNKADMLGGSEDRQKEQMAVDWAKKMGIGNETCLISCSSLFGWDEMMHRLARHIKKTWEASSSQQMPLTKVRHRQHLQECLAHLQAFKGIDEDMVVLAAEELRKASESLGRITGKIGIEDVLDALFSQFCIGK
ncbi:tRNA modification GTPase GTPBP3, mitochondrial-like protein [Martensiomyces pterosporus]|nr:tRNA modification GTPase GTPBP3, mitochondrial-like protein [Martensiomyces pterosporus]